MGIAELEARASAAAVRAWKKRTATMRMGTGPRPDANGVASPPPASRTGVLTDMVKTTFCLGANQRLRVDEV
jgi:hypothetical protein